jgi:hypothetical protein
MPTNAAATGFWTAMPGNARVNSAAQGRLMLQAIFGNNDATPLNGTRSGVVSTTGTASGADLKVTVTSGLTMAVAPGIGVAHRAAEGPYEGWLKAAGSITTDAAPASNPRNDIVVMRLYDTTKGDTLPASGDPCKIEIMTGTPAASPLDPITVNALGVYTIFPAQTGSGTGGVGIPLARAQVSTAGVITLTDLRRSCAPVGAVRYLLPGDNPATAPVRAGELQFNPTANVLQMSDTSGNWKTMQSGTVEFEQACTGDYTLTGSYADITGASITFTTTVPNAVCIIDADFDLRTIITGTGYCYGAVMVDGVLNTTRPCLQVYQSQETRSHGRIRIKTTLAAAGSHTIKLQGKKDSGGTAVFTADTTVLSLTVYGA